MSDMEVFPKKTLNLSSVEREGVYILKLNKKLFRSALIDKALKQANDLR